MQRNSNEFGFVFINKDKKSEPFSIKISISQKQLTKPIYLPNINSPPWILNIMNKAKEWNPNRLEALKHSLSNDFY